jgi:MoaA/NifB/PqqE/SkfB family radical SAM enzyme
MFENAPYAFDFALTSYCQSKCRTCPRTNSETGEVESWLTIRHVPFDKWKKNTISLSNNMKIMSIKFCGQTGDPMMHPDITKFIDHAFTLTNLVIIATNGGIRSSEWYREMGNKYGDSLKIVFGIDGIDHNTNWKYREGVDFNKAFKNMVTYAQSPGTAQWDFLVFEWNYQQIPEVARMAAELNIRRLEFKINNGDYGLLDSSKLPMVKEMICQNTI